MIEAKISQEDGFEILTDSYGDEWAISLEKDNYIEFPNEDGKLVSFLIADVIEFLQTLEGKK